MLVRARGQSPRQDSQIEMRWSEEGNHHDVTGFHEIVRPQVRRASACYTAQYADMARCRVADGLSGPSHAHAELGSDARHPADDSRVHGKARHTCA